MNFNAVGNATSDKRDGCFAIGDYHIPPPALVLVTAVQHSVAKLYAKFMQAFGSLVFAKDEVANDGKAEHKCQLWRRQEENKR